ncbi:MAG: hypothetical protein Q4E13_03545 [Clostridia bacterium]|nr:hypothetical protein [Clostridia bacterium]
MAEKLWWHKPMRVIQDNLQVADTPRMDPEKIARETQEMHASVLVINAGGIYAWYPSKVRYHHVNEYLPRDFDLFGRLIEECHKRDIKVVARFDFSKTDDYVSQEHPEWFVRNPDGTRRAYGQERPGNWSILYLTCANSGYRNEEVAVPVLEEVIDNYPIDGIFLNAPHYDYCTCDACKEKYFKLYGKPLPVHASDEKGEESYGSMPAPKEMEPSFAGICYRDNIGVMYRAIKKKAPDMPLILYYGIHNENLNDRLNTADMLCTEAQDILSRGWKDIPPMWMPTIIMKMGRAQPEGNPKPFGIIHSCPGMDWRHTGLPINEYRSWLRQIPAAGGTIWHSVTGFNDTITDKRIVKAVGEVNGEIARIEADMDGAQERSDVLLLWNSKKTHSWAQLLVNTQTQFDIRDPYQITDELLAKYPAVVLPDEYPLTDEFVAMLRRYAENGGNLIVEGTTSEQLKPFADAIGIRDSIRTSEYLRASYWQFEPEGAGLRGAFEETPILPHRGWTAYTRALPGTKVLATLIPPFAPVNSVGAPPERASILVKHTDIPLCTLNDFGAGKVMMLPFRIAELADAYRLAEFYQLWSNAVDLLLGEKRALRMNVTQGLVTNAYQKDDKLLVHMVNAIGQRPLMNNVPYTDFTFRVALPEGKAAANVEGVLGDASFDWKPLEGAVEVRVNRLKLWEMFRITLQ